MSTERGNYRIITVHAPFLAIRTIVADCVVCFFGEETKTKYWEFAKMFETMVGVEFFQGYKRAVCDTCRYSIF